MEFIEVESVENKSYKGSVYDLGVKTDHTYTINDYSVHNSAAGSIVCYLIGITNIDPLKHDLMFERFLDPARDDLPDIDTDFEPRIRDAVVDYMIKDLVERIQPTLVHMVCLKQNPPSKMLLVFSVFQLQKQWL